MSTARSVHSARGAAALRTVLREERGVALPLALLVLLILAALAVALSEMTAAELDTQRLTRWDRQAPDPPLGDLGPGGDRPAGGRRRPAGTRHPCPGRDRLCR